MGECGLKDLRVSLRLNVWANVQRESLKVEINTLAGRLRLLCRLLKKTVQCGRGEQRGEAYVGCVAGFDESRTVHGKRRISARGGWAGERGDFFCFL